MIVGLPGTGIGGLFYLISAFLMPLVEVIKAIQGRSSVKRWKEVISLFAMAVGIFLTLWAEFECLAYIFPERIANTLIIESSHITVAINLLRHALLTPLIFITIPTLLGIVLIIELLRVIFGRRKSCP